MSASNILDISIEPEFHPFITAAILRMKYIFPELEFAATEEGVAVNGTSDLDCMRLEREVTYQIYREKVFQQTLALRQSLYEMLSR